MYDFTIQKTSQIKVCATLEYASKLSGRDDTEDLQMQILQMRPDLVRNKLQPTKVYIRQLTTDSGSPQVDAHT